MIITEQSSSPGSGIYPGSQTIIYWASFLLLTKLDPVKIIFPSNTSKTAVINNLGLGAVSYEELCLLCGCGCGL